MLESGRIRLERLRERAFGVGDRSTEVLFVFRTEGRAEQRERRRREPRLHDRSLVGEVQDDRRLGERRGRRAGIGGDDGPRRAVEAFEELDHLGRRAAPADRDDAVVPPIARELRGGERVGLAPTNTQDRDFEHHARQGSGS